METKKLEMIFLSAAGKNFTLAVDNPREDLEVDEIESSMNKVIEANVFAIDNHDLKGIGKARYVTRTVEDVI